MKNSYRGKKSVKYLLIVCIALFLSGCGAAEKEKGKTIQVTIPDYQKLIYDTTLVKYGTMEPELTLQLTLEDFKLDSYSTTNDMLEVKEINVEKGSRVEPGDVMVTFKADEIEKTLQEYEERKDEIELLIAHYSKLMKISKDADYSTDIKKLKNDLAVAETYIKEQNERLSGYMLVAENSGTVTYVHEELYKGYGLSGEKLIKVASGSSNYVASTTDDYNFQIGDVFQAQYQIARYDMKVISVEKKDGANVITFEPPSNMSGVAEEDQLSIIIKKKKIENTMYVEQAVVFSLKDKNYVYVVDEKGYREAVEITIGDTVDEYVVIKDGLKEGDQVVVN